jgi:hypothetical protein
MSARVHGILGVRTADGRIVKLLEFLEPAETVTVFTTTVDKQKRARFDFYYRDNPDQPWLYLDALTLNRISPARAGEPDLRIQAQSDSRGNLLLGIEGTGTDNPQIFSVDAESLLQRCRQFESSSSGRSGDVQAAVGANERVAHSGQYRNPLPSASVMGRGRRRRRVGWFALILLVPVLLLVFFLMDPQLRFPEREAVKSVDKNEIEAPVEAESRTPAFSDTRSSAFEPKDPDLSSAPSQSEEKPIRILSTPAGEKDEHSTVTSSYQGTGEMDWYQIVWGDTLWRIAERFYGDRELYPELADSNSLSDPDYIIAGEPLVLPPELEGRNRVHISE